MNIRTIWIAHVELEGRLHPSVDLRKFLSEHPSECSAPHERSRDGECGPRCPKSSPPGPYSALD